MKLSIACILTVIFLSGCCNRIVVQEKFPLPDKSLLATPAPLQTLGQEVK